SAEFAEIGAINFSICSFYALFAPNPYKPNPEKCLNGLNWIEDRFWDPWISLDWSRVGGFYPLLQKV
ncbi:MAG: hypothetical protein Q7V05_11160, partial [Methanoregula sp.]|nr:hypothetical protein [Methanoregula sp.]